MDGEISLTQQAPPSAMTPLGGPPLAAPPPIQRERPTASRVPSSAFTAALQQSTNNFTISAQFFKDQVLPRTFNDEEQRRAHDHIRQIKDMLDRNFVMVAPSYTFGGKRKTRRRKIARRRR